MARVGHLLTQGRQGLSAALGHGRLRTEADNQSGWLRRVEHPLISPLSIAKRLSQCPTFANAELTCGSPSSFSVADRRHSFTCRDHRYGYWNRSPMTGRHQSRSTVGLDRLQRHYFGATLSSTAWKKSWVKSSQSAVCSLIHLANVVRTTPASLVLKPVWPEWPMTCGERFATLPKNGEHVRLNWGPLRRRWNSRRTVRMCCSRHSCRLVCALRVPVPHAQSHQRAGAHRADVAREAPGKSGACEQRILCCVDSGVVLVAVSESRPGVSILNSESLHSSVSVRHCRSTCCG